MFPELAELKVRNQGRKKRRGKRMSKAARKVISRRMKAYFKKRREEKGNG
jgi:hypothetical protein